MDQRPSSSPEKPPTLIFERFHPPLSENQCRVIKKILNKYVLGIFIARSGGDILYSFQVDPKIRANLISQFISALAIFGEENVGKIKRILIEGLDIELSVVADHDLMSVTFFRPMMVKDYLEEEAKKGLKLFAEKFQDAIKAGKTNQGIYTSFDDVMCELIQDYLNRIGVKFE